MTLEDLLSKLESSRAWLFKLLDGIAEDAWDARLNGQTMSVRQTLAHMAINDRVLPVVMSGEEPNYEAYAPDATLSPAELLALLRGTHAEKLTWLRTEFGDKDLGTVINDPYFGERPLWSMLLTADEEEWYHIGQLSAIRQGVEPEWNYYAHFY